MLWKNIAFHANAQTADTQETKNRSPDSAWTATSSDEVKRVTVSMEWAPHGDVSTYEGHLGCNVSKVVPVCCEGCTVRIGRGTVGTLGKHMNQGAENNMINTRINSRVDYFGFRFC